MTGTVLTWLSAPVSFLDVCTELPPALGLGSALLGTYASARGAHKSSQAKWATFNSFPHD